MTVELRFFDPNSADPQHRKTAAQVADLAAQIVQLLHTSGLDFAKAFDVICNVARVYVQSYPEASASLLGVLDAIARTPMECSECVMNEAKHASQH